MTPSIEVLKVEVKSIIVSNDNKATAKQIQDDYRAINGTDIPYESFGYYTLENLLQSVDFSTVVKCERDRFGLKTFRAVVNSDTAHIQRLVAGQRKKDEPRGSSRSSSSHFDWRKDIPSRVRSQPPAFTASSSRPAVHRQLIPSQVTLIRKPSIAPTSPEGVRPNGFSHLNTPGIDSTMAIYPKQNSLLQGDFARPATATPAAATRPSAGSGASSTGKVNGDGHHSHVNGYTSSSEPVKEFNHTGSISTCEASRAEYEYSQAEREMIARSRPMFTMHITFSTESIYPHAHHNLSWPVMR